MLYVKSQRLKDTFSLEYLQAHSASFSSIVPSQINLLRAGQLAGHQQQEPQGLTLRADFL